MRPAEGWPAGLNRDEVFEVMEQAIVSRYGTNHAGVAQAALDALAPLIAKAVEEADWRQDVEEVRGYYPEDIFLPDSDSLDAKSARVARLTCDLVIRAHEARKAGK